MPGHIGTSIVTQLGAILGRRPEGADRRQVAQMRERIASAPRGIDLSAPSDDDLRARFVPRGPSRSGDDAPR
jgi:hypothetical protein